MSMAGLLRDRVTIQYRDVTRDALGGEIVAWKTLARVPAFLDPLWGSERMPSGGFPQVRAERISRLLIRYRPDVRASMQVRFNRRTLRIEQVEEVQRRQYVYLVCTEANEAVNG